MATNTINDLYLKYVNKVGRTLENDRYFQYLYEMVQAGENVLQQNNQILHKVVDERWLATIEESLDAINTIIEKPRRFVTTTEEVVPVALAKKITADSVRHLSMNTQFIASSEDGDIQPTRVLNVSTEESYDLYENRFVYHLIQRLVTFIDKRTDVIFWATGDETQNVLSYQSKVDDAYEEIEYKIEMKVKNRQSFAENDADNMGVFMRIDRVRRMVMALKNSAFCGLMAGCAKVRSPIQRTNLIMKDPNYRTCYKLWQFLENYDEVGYTIEVENNALQFDEEYLIQMYTNLITNYTVFKSLLEGDNRKVSEPLAKKRRAIKPKFIKKIKEEIVDNPDIEDVEIRQVFVEEVTQAQLDAEAKLAEETQNRIKAEEALEEMDSQMVFLQQQVSNLMMMNQEAEIRAEEERQAKEDALASVEDKVRECKEAADQQLQETVAALNQQMEETVADLNQQMEDKEASLQQELYDTKATLQQKIEETKEDCRLRIQETNNSAAQRIEEAETKANQRIAQVEASAQKRVEEIQASAEQQVEEIRVTSERKVKDTEETANRRITETESFAKKQIEDVQNATVRRINEIETVAKQTLEESKQQEKRKLEQIREQTDKKVAGLRKEKNALELEVSQVKRRKNQWKTMAQSQQQKAEDLEQQLAASIAAREQLEKELAKVRIEAEQARQEAKANKERAEANTLSHYIISTLNERKRRGDKSTEEEK